MKPTGVTDDVMTDFVFKKTGTLHLLIHKNLQNRLSDKWWHNMCFNNYTDGCLIKKGTHKTVFTLALKEKIFFVKKYSTTGFFGRLKSLFCISRAKREFLAAVYMKKKGIASPEPLFLAEAKKGPLVTESFFGMTFLTDAVELKDIFFKLPGIARIEKSRIAEETGRLAGRVFQSGIVQQDCSVNNFMAVKSGSGFMPVFIDFEKVQVGKQIPSEEKHGLLAKLNRVGKEISLTDRFRFLRGYRQTDPEASPALVDLARQVHRNTLDLLKKDLRRKRATSIYTHAQYSRIKKSGAQVIFRKGLNPDELIHQTSGLKSGARHIQQNGSATQLPVLRVTPRQALTVWSVINVLIVAGLPVDMPLCLVQHPDHGVILFSDGFLGQYRRFSGSTGRLKQFFDNHFSKQIQMMDDLISSLARA